MRPAGVLVAIAVAAGVGCGYTDVTPKTRARATAETFVESCARGYPNRAVELLTNGLQRAFVQEGSRGCDRLLGMADADRVDSVRLHGARATATVAGPSGGRSQLDLGFFEDAWLVQGPAARLESER